MSLFILKSCLTPVSVELEWKYAIPPVVREVAPIMSMTFPVVVNGPVIFITYR